MRFVVLCIARAWPATHTASSGTTLGNSYSRGVTEQYADVGERIRRTHIAARSRVPVPHSISTSRILLARHIPLSVCQPTVMLVARTSSN